MAQPLSAPHDAAHAYPTNTASSRQLAHPPESCAAGAGLYFLLHRPTGSVDSAGAHQAGVWCLGHPDGPSHRSGLWPDLRHAGNSRGAPGRHAQSPQHRRPVLRHLEPGNRRLRLCHTVLAHAGGPHDRGRGRSRRHGALHLHRLGLLPAQDALVCHQPVHDGPQSGHLAGPGHRRCGGPVLRLALRVSGFWHSGRHPEPDRVFLGQGACARRL